MCIMYISNYQPVKLYSIVAIWGEIYFIMKNISNPTDFTRKRNSSDEKLSLFDK